MSKLNIQCVACRFLNIYQKIHQFLSSIERDVHKRKLVPFYLPHSVVLPDHFQALKARQYRTNTQV